MGRIRVAVEISRGEFGTSTPPVENRSA